MVQFMRKPSPFLIPAEYGKPIWPATSGSLLYWDRLAILLVIRIDSRDKHTHGQQLRNFLDSRPRRAR